MNVLIVGGGGREHALAWAITRSPGIGEIFVAPGNGGTDAIAKNVAIAPNDIDGLIQLARDNNVSLTIVGPEAPLVAGIVDRFDKAGLRCFGPGREAARLEGSKVFAKEFMARHGIPTADFAVFDDPDAAKEHVSKGQGPLVIKADGLAQGKGVIVALTRGQALSAVDQIMVQKKFGDGGGRVVIE